MDFIPILAQGAPASGGGPYDFLFSLAPIFLVLPIWYFLMIRPQQQRVSDHRAMIEAVSRGDTIETSGGIIGKVIRVVDENEVQVEIADGVRVRLLRQTISKVRSRSDTTKKDAA